jgi:hypothetical protein
LKLWKFGYLEQRLIPNPDFRQNAQCCRSPADEVLPVSGSFFPVSGLVFPVDDQAIFLSSSEMKKRKSCFIITETKILEWSQSKSSGKG